MSRQNKVNPGRYTQRGRLTQDDAARELRKQSSIGSPHTWQPVNTKAARPRMKPADDANGEGKPVTANKKAIESPTSNARAKAGTANTVTTRKSKRTTGTAKTNAAAKSRKAGTAAAKRTTPRPATRRRKS